ncbi:hypothetical protein BDV93DRAFT_545061 [Ceratobasidium sp. AG-I]|nr:hypothetical protein BDV93DRAFT_545061 [Ceratobasidium sp. AG-I]
MRLQEGQGGRDERTGWAFRPPCRSLSAPLRGKQWIAGHGEYAYSVPLHFIKQIENGSTVILYIALSRQRRQVTQRIWRAAVAHLDSGASWLLLQIIHTPGVTLQEQGDVNSTHTFPTYMVHLSDDPSHYSSQQLPHNPRLLLRPLLTLFLLGPVVVYPLRSATVEGVTSTSSDGELSRADASDGRVAVRR